MRSHSGRCGCGARDEPRARRLRPRPRPRCGETLGTAAAPAAADVYEAVFDVTLQLHRESSYESGSFGVVASRADAAVALRGRLPDVRVEGGRLVAGPLGLPPAGPVAEVTTASGSFEETIGSAPARACSVSRAQASGAPRLLASHDGSVLRFSPLAALRLTCACPDFSDTTA